MRFMNMYILLIIIALIVAIANVGPSGPRTYKMVVCRDQHGVVTNEKMLEAHIVPRSLPKGCEIEVREFNTPD